MWSIVVEFKEKLVRFGITKLPFISNYYNRRAKIFAMSIFFYYINFEENHISVIISAKHNRKRTKTKQTNKKKTTLKINIS